MNGWSWRIYKINVHVHVYNHSDSYLRHCLATEGVQRCPEKSSCLYSLYSKGECSYYELVDCTVDVVVLRQIQIISEL